MADLVENYQSILIGQTSDEALATLIVGHVSDIFRSETTWRQELKREIKVFSFFPLPEWCKQEVVIWARLESEGLLEQCRVYSLDKFNVVEQTIDYDYVNEQDVLVHSMTLVRLKI